MSRAARAAAADVPMTSTSPDVAGMRSAATRRSVDFPQPDGPSSVRKPPCATVMLTRSSAVTAPRSVVKRTVTSRNRTAGLSVRGASARARAAASDKISSPQPIFGRSFSVISRILVVIT